MKIDVILVNEKDEQIGLCEKMEAHKKGLLHRAFSVFVFNSKWELLLQRRALEKYHSWGLWTNTVCSHPKDWENLVEWIKVRMIEEMWFKTVVEEVFSFLYKSDYEDWMIENEYDHVFIWMYDKNPEPNLDEVMDFTWKDIEEIKNDIKINGEKYTSWFKIILENEEFLEKINKIKK